MTIAFSDSLRSLQLLYSLGIDSEMVRFEEAKLLSEAFLDTNQLGRRGFFVRCHFSSPFFAPLEGVLIFLRRGCVILPPNTVAR